MMVRRTAAGGSLPDRRTARVRRRLRRQLPPHRADAGRHLDLLRRGPGPRVAAQHRHGWKPAFAGQHPPVVWRLAWPLGGQYARDRRDELQSENRFSGLAREPASGRALDAHRAGPRSNTRSRSKIRRCGRGHGPSSRSSPGRATRRTEFITSRAASKETMAFRGCMRGARVEELAFAEGRGPDPATKDNATDFVGVEADPLQ